MVCNSWVKGTVWTSKLELWTFSLLNCFFPKGIVTKARAKCRSCHLCQYPVILYDSVFLHGYCYHNTYVQKTKSWVGSFHNLFRYGFFGRYTECSQVPQHHLHRISGNFAGTKQLAIKVSLCVTTSHTVNICFAQQNKHSCIDTFTFSVLVGSGIR